MLNDIAVEAAYQEILGRHADQAGLSHFLTLSQEHKLTFGRLLHILSQSEEFHLRSQDQQDRALRYLAHNSHPSEKIHWFHTINLTDGFKTNGMQTQEFVEKSVFKYPVHGQTLLDIGAWDGFYSFRAEQLGAKEVLATDWYCWGGPGWGTKDGFNFAHANLQSRVKSLEVDVFALDPDVISLFDTVLFLGVFYHLTDPLMGLRKASAMARSHLVVLTHVCNNEVDKPLMEYREGFNGDDTTFWYPNLACLKAMLTREGFREFDAIAVEEGPSGVPIGSGDEKGVERYTLHAFR